MGQAASTSSADKAYEDLVKHREALFAQQLEYHRQCEQTKQEAERQLELKNRKGALNLARQVRTLEAQQARVAGLVNNLDNQKASLETHQITKKSMSVIAACVRTLGKNAVSLQAVDAIADASCEASDDLREVAEALSLPYNAEDTEEDLLQLIKGEAKTEIPRSQGGGGQDDRFFEWLRQTARGVATAETSLPLLPSVPTHKIPLVKKRSKKVEHREIAFVM